ncbi:MAG: SDR family NAD(P)-dependent oxidoreductase [Bacteroidales bacterium]|jgi:glycerol-3-phosphate cytidylyltransferase|nr:SDR family NAD(P)-dependent oxidoreductase [Bacteroidales bacterium]
MSNKALIIGGSNGIGLAIGHQLLERGYEKIHVLDRSDPPSDFKDKIDFTRFNLLSDDYSILNQFTDINTLVVTAGFGRIALFEDITDAEIINGFKVNSVAVCRIIRHFYQRIVDNKDFYCCVTGSIAGLISSPMFAVYGATKASVCKFIESINIEIEKAGSTNRVLNLSPGLIKGTRFYGNENNPEELRGLAEEMIEKMLKKESLFIPFYEEIYKDVITRYQTQPDQFGKESYDYKNQSDHRKSTKPQFTIGYLSGTFDLFHIGHLNLLKRAKEYCDYLVVGVHKNALHKNKTTFISFEERLEIIKSIRFVDKVIQSYKEDTDAYKEIKYDYLFVGSDYNGSDRFNKYEDYFKDKAVKIIYLPYTQRTSSTQIRNLIDSANI